jgi:hypothetical protein
MTELASRIQTEVTAAVNLLRELDPQPGAPGRWSTKEILGHLIDSAANNHQRFVRALVDGHLKFPAYEQQSWVSVQRYQEAPWDELIGLFAAYNIHLARLIATIPDEAKTIECQIGEGPSQTLGELAEDYLRHLRHHLHQIVLP